METRGGTVDPRLPSGNPWRTGVLITAMLIAALAIGGAVVAGLRHVASPKSAGHVERSAAVQSRAIEDCNAPAAQARRDTGRIVKDGAIGGAVGAGVGAAGGAVVDRHHSVGRGAGIGALVGAAAGTLYGLNEENKKSEQARAAYAECMARNGY